MTSFKTKLLAAVFVPALALAAGAAGAAGTQTTQPSATTTTPSTSGNSMQNGMKSDSMKSGTTSADATFDRLDKNHDGKLTSSEAAADPKVHAKWKKLDANNKDAVTKSEFEAHASDIK